MGDDANDRLLLSCSTTAMVMTVWSGADPVLCDRDV
jgi:hypothetical protein